MNQLLETYYTEIKLIIQKLKNDSRETAREK